MHRATIAAALAAVAVTITTAPALADVQVGVHINIPAPPVYTFDAPPRLVVVPGYPNVHYAPDVSVNFFSYGGRYYTYDDGNWFVARSNRGPWGYVERRYVPAPLLRVPTRYYHVPPRLVGGGHWDDDHYRHDRYDRDGDRKHWKKHWKKHGKGHRGHGRKHDRD
jgi:hypothetical protein